jgi:hypothetical protein
MARMISPRKGAYWRDTSSKGTGVGVLDTKAGGAGGTFQLGCEGATLINSPARKVFL